MQRPPLDAGKKCWDSWKAFHWAFTYAGSATESGGYGYTPIVAFETGEVVYTHQAPGPDMRIKVHQFNFTIFGTNDASAPDLVVPDGEPEVLKRVWLEDNGQQYLLWDHDTNHVVRLGSLLEDHRVPQWLRKRANAYFTGEGAPPVGAPVVVSRPGRGVLTKDELAHIDGMKASCDMAMAMTTPLAWDQAEGRASGKGKNVPVDLTRLLEAGEVLALTNNEKIRLAAAGVGRARTEHQYLLAV